MPNQYIQWTQQEIEFLRENYQASAQHYLTTNLQNRNWKSIVKKASILGLERLSILRKADLSILLEDTPATYYWIGFLMADGSFSERRLHLGVARKDLEHLKKFLNFVNSENKIGKIKNKYGKTHFRIKITCVRIIQALRQKFKISSRKTYEPCSIQHIKNQELLFSLIVGFLDGDGCVTQNRKFPNCYNIGFISHPSWLDNFCFIKKFLYNYFNHKDTTMLPKITKRCTTLPQDETHTKKEYFAVEFHISKTSLVKAIRAKAAELNLPFLERKLGQIQLSAGL